MADTLTLPSSMHAPSRNLDLSKKSRGSQRLERVETAVRSFRILRRLTPEQIDAFMSSYVIYDLDWADEKMMIETLGPDYQKRVGQCLADYYGVLSKSNDVRKAPGLPISMLHLEIMSWRSKYLVLRFTNGFCATKSRKACLQVTFLEIATSIWKQSATRMFEEFADDLRKTIFVQWVN